MSVRSRRPIGLAWIVLAVLLMAPAATACDWRPSEDTETERLAAQSHRGGGRRDRQDRADLAGASGPDASSRNCRAAPFTSYCGLPKEYPQAETAQQILAESNWQTASTALAQSAERPDPWQVADSALDIGIGVCALFGGVLGTRAVRFLQEARAKSQALKEIIQGNELFKTQNADQVAAFKAAQQNQSPETRQLVTAIKGKSGLTTETQRTQRRCVIVDVGGLIESPHSRPRFSLSSLCSLCLCGEPLFPRENRP